MYGSHSAAGPCPLSTADALCCSFLPLPCTLPASSLCWAHGRQLSSCQQGEQVGVRASASFSPGFPSAPKAPASLAPEVPKTKLAQGFCFGLACHWVC